MAGKPVVASWNVGCFSDYQYTLHTNFFSLCRNLKNVLFNLSVGTKICVFAPTLCQFQRQSWRKSISTKNGIISRKAKYACLQAITSMKFGDYGKYTFRWNAIGFFMALQWIKNRKTINPLLSLSLYSPPPLLFAGRDLTRARVFRSFYSNLLPRISLFPFLSRSRERKERDFGTTVDSLLTDTSIRRTPL